MVNFSSFEYKHASNNYIWWRTSEATLSIMVTSMRTFKELVYTFFPLHFQMSEENSTTVHVLVAEFLPQLPPYCLRVVSVPRPSQPWLGTWHVLAKHVTRREPTKRVFVQFIETWPDSLVQLLSCVTYLRVNNISVLCAPTWFCFLFLSPSLPPFFSILFQHCALWIHFFCFLFY